MPLARAFQSIIMNYPQRIFMTIGGCFKHYMYCVTVLGWLKIVEEKTLMMNNSDFQPFQVCHFKIIVTTHCYYYCRLGQAL